MSFKFGFKWPESDSIMSTGRLFKRKGNLTPGNITEDVSRCITTCIVHCLWQNQPVTTKNRMVTAGETAPNLERQQPEQLRLAGSKSESVPIDTPVLKCPTLWWKQTCLQPGTKKTVLVSTANFTLHNCAGRIFSKIKPPASIIFEYD